MQKFVYQGKLMVRGTEALAEVYYTSALQIEWESTKMSLIFCLPSRKLVKSFCLGRPLSVIVF